MSSLGYSALEFADPITDALSKYSGGSLAWNENVIFYHGEDVDLCLM